MINNLLKSYSDENEAPTSSDVEKHPCISVSRQMQEKFARRKLWRRIMALTYVTTLLTYLSWRYTIINPESLGLSLAYYIAECVGFILGLKAVFNSWNYNHRDPIPSPPGLKVDVLLPVYKEPLEIIRHTVMAAKNISYPHRTIILDDGKRDDLKQLAAELEVDYLRRPDNANAKAGNLNYGLQNSTADYVTVFDADHIAMPHALDLMLGFFIDDKVAMVQTPQDYYNTNAFQYVNAKNGALWHDQSVFYGISQPCADASNAAECVGTGVTYRRAALDLIGGIPTSTVTEDTHTSLCLHKAGLKTVYINEPVAYGLAAADLSEYYKTRHRWGFGNLQAVREENVLFCKGLTLKQKLHYFFLSVIYLEGWQQLLIFLIPCLTLIFGLQSFTVTVFNTLVIMTFPFISYALLQEIGCGFTRYWANEIFSMARWPVYISASAGVFSSKIRFRSSHKTSRGVVSWRLMAPQLFIMVLSIASIIIGVFHMINTGFRTGPIVDYILAIASGVTPYIDMHTPVSRGFTVDLFILSSVWALYTVARVLHFVQKSRSVANNTHDYFRFDLPIPVITHKNSYGCISSISEEYARLSFYGKPHFKNGDILEFTAFLSAGELKLKMQIERSALQNNTQILEGRLLWSSASQRDLLANSLYSVDWHREFLHRHAHFKTPSDIILSCFGFHSETSTKLEWNAVLLNNGYGVISGFSKNNQATLIIFSELTNGNIYEGMFFGKEGPELLKIEISGKEALHSLAETGLDGAKLRRYSVINLLHSCNAVGIKHCKITTIF